MLFCKPASAGRRLQPRQACIYLLCLLTLTFTVAAAHADQASLTLANALSRTIKENPDLRVFDLRLEGLERRRI